MAIPGERASLEQQLGQRERELEAVRQVAHALAVATDENSLARLALHAALQVVGAEAGAILLYDLTSKQLVFRYVEGGGGSRLRDRYLPVTQGIAGEVFLSGRARISQDVAREASHARFIGEEVGYETHNLITVPLSRREGPPIGVMQVLNKRTGDLDEWDLHLLETLGSHVALAIEQARLYQEAKLAEVARLLGDIGHDLKNMITPVVAAAGVLEAIIEELLAEQAAEAAAHQAEAAPPGEAHSEALHAEAISILKDASRRVQGRVKEIADCVKGVTAPPKFTTCDVNGLAKQVMDMLRPVADQEGIALLLEPGEAVPSVEGDEDRLFSMLYNLVDNAVSAVRRAERPGQVAVMTSAAPSAQEVVIQVCDTGCGMDRETQAHLFTTGVRSHTSLGTGLGTRIVRNAVEMHAGRIGVESELGQGTTFRVELPVSQRHYEAEGAAAG